MPELTSWNVEGRLSPYSKEGRGSPEHILKKIAELNSDIVFLPEAFGVHPEISPKTNEALTALGYVIHDVAYDEGGAVRDDAAIEQPHLRLLSKYTAESYETVRLGNLRNAIVAVFKDPDTDRLFRLIAVHLDDRSEALRQTQLEDLIPIINDSSLPTIMAGDYNAMDGRTLRAHLLRSRPMKVLSRSIGTNAFSHIVKRTVEMAAGTTMSVLVSETGLEDTNVHHSPTTTPKMRHTSWLPSIALIDIDHVMTSEGIYVASFEIGAEDSGSDHRPLTISFTLAA